MAKVRICLTDLVLNEAAESCTIDGESPVVENDF